MFIIIDILDLKTGYQKVINHKRFYSHKTRTELLYPVPFAEKKLKFVVTAVLVSLVMLFAAALISAFSFSTPLLINFQTLCRDV